STIKHQKVVSEAEWLKARKKLLAKEKEFTQLRDQLSAERRNLPWVKVDKRYVFDGPKGKETLADLFDGRSQLIVYHFMFGPDWGQGCPHCSFWADNFNEVIVHINARDASLVAVSRAPYGEIAPYQTRMGWSFKWLSSAGSEFNYDYGVAFHDPEARAFNYGTLVPGMEDREGISVFCKEDGAIYHTYSTYARGIDMM